MHKLSRKKYGKEVAGFGFYISLWILLPED